MSQTASTGTMWKDHGTKILGSIIAVNSLLATGSLALPPPLNQHSAAVVSWAAFINVILGVLVAGRGYGNTAAIASEVVQQQVVSGLPVTPGVASASATTAPLVKPPEKAP